MVDLLLGSGVCSEEAGHWGCYLEGCVSLPTSHYLLFPGCVCSSPCPVSDGEPSRAFCDINSPLWHVL